MLCLYYFGSEAEVNVNHLQKVFKWLGMNGDVDWNDIMEGIVLSFHFISTSQFPTLCGEQTIFVTPDVPLNTLSSNHLA